MTRKQLENLLLEAVNVARDCGLRGPELVTYARALAREATLSPAKPAEVQSFTALNEARSNRKVSP